jgi:hypothetical protein
MKVKITEQQLRQIIKESIIKEARMSRPGFRGKRIQMKSCDFYNQLISFKDKDGNRAFTDAQARGINKSLSFGIPVGGCEVIELGLFGIAKLLGYSSESKDSDKKIDIDSFEVRDYCKRSEDEIETINPNFSAIAQSYFPNTIISINDNSSPADIRKSLELDQSKIKSDIKRLKSVLEDQTESAGDLATIYKSVAELFKFISLKDFQTFHGKVNGELRTALNKFPSAVLKAKKDLVDQNLERILADKIKIAYDEFKNYSETNEEFKSMFENSKYQKFFERILKP